MDPEQQESTGPTPAETTAREMGWRPEKEYRGSAPWVDAETFISRGEHFLPIIKADRDRLRGQVSELTAAQERTAAALAAAQEAIDQLKEFGAEETKRQVKAAKANLLRELKDAREAGDIDAQVRLEDQLDELRTTQAAPPPPAASPPASPPPPKEDPLAKAFIDRNAWFKTDTRLRHLSFGIANELREKNPDLSGQAFYDKLQEEMDAYTEPQGRQSNKVAGGRASPSNSSGRTSRTRGYDDLPADAKVTCDRQAAKLVGPGRAFKDTANWQAYYANIYFQGEAA